MKHTAHASQPHTLPSRSKSQPHDQNLSKSVSAQPHDQTDDNHTNEREHRTHNIVYSAFGG